MNNNLYALLEMETNEGNTIRSSLETVLKFLKSELEEQGYAHPVNDKNELKLMYALDEFLNGN